MTLVSLRPKENTFKEWKRDVATGEDDLRINITRKQRWKGTLDEMCVCEQRPRSSDYDVKGLKDYWS